LLPFIHHSFLPFFILISLPLSLLPLLFVFVFAHFYLHSFPFRLFVFRCFYFLQATTVRDICDVSFQESHTLSCCPGILPSGCRVVTSRICSRFCRLPNEPHALGPGEVRVIYLSSFSTHATGNVGFAESEYLYIYIYKEEFCLLGYNAV
jgi:hypothetical protein